MVIILSKRNVFCFKRKYNVRTNLWDTLYYSAAWYRQITAACSRRSNGAPVSDVIERGALVANSGSYGRARVSPDNDAPVVIVLG